jgi:hypothetical protein
VDGEAVMMCSSCPRWLGRIEEEGLGVLRDKEGVEKKRKGERRKERSGGVVVNRRCCSRWCSWETRL